MLELTHSQDVVIPSPSFLRCVECTLVLLGRSYHSNQLPESIKKFISSISDKKDNRDLLAHCKQELIQAVWAILLDGDFIEAYKNGIVVECFDGILRRVYPRIFTYSADYPEK